MILPWGWTVSQDTKPCPVCMPWVSELDALHQARSLHRLSCLVRVRGWLAACGELPFLIYAVAVPCRSRRLRRAAWEGAGAGHGIGRYHGQSVAACSNSGVQPQVQLESLCRQLPGMLTPDYLCNLTDEGLPWQSLHPWPLESHRTDVDTDMRSKGEDRCQHKKPCTILRILPTAAACPICGSGC